MVEDTDREGPRAECGGKGYVIEAGPEFPRTPMDGPLWHTCETCGEIEPVDRLREDSESPDRASNQRGEHAMRIVALVGLYLAAIVAANQIITEYGPPATPYVAFGFVAFDLVVRDLLHVEWERRQLWLRMAALVGTGGVLSYLLNAEAQTIAIASTVAFCAAGVVDTAIYQALRRADFDTRATVSSVGAAVTDSALFVWLAFPGFLFSVAFVQAGMKVAGATVFLLALRGARRLVFA